MPRHPLPFAVLLLALTACPGVEAPVCTADADCGAEAPVCHEGACVACAPGASTACYDGPSGTRGVGRCEDGLRTCRADGSGFGDCEGQVLPASENCSDAVDDDCSGAANDAAECVCTPGATQSCYGGPSATAGVGICLAGTQQCNAAGTGFGDCEGQVLPGVENCSDAVDDDCSGAANDAPQCACTPGESRSCYDGPEGSAGVGICLAGVQTCNAAGTDFGPCEGQVVPAAENCTDEVDDDCSGAPNDAAQCMCTPGSNRQCYSGPVGTQNVGTCRGGQQACNAQGTGYGPCVGEVLPLAQDVCGNNLDDNCNGAPDESLDVDGDGWARCDNDCCDAAGDGCADPVAVNPGAWDFAGNGVDDDCSGGTDDAITQCDEGLASNSGDSTDYARAMDLCSTTVLSPPSPAQRRWGVISASRTLTFGAGAPSADASALRSSYGAILPQSGAAFAVLSTGVAAAGGQTNPSYAGIDTNFSVSSDVPVDWYAANSNQLPNAPGCPQPSSTTAFDPVMLTLQVRVPTNAHAFRLRAFVVTAEFPEWVCSPFNDFFVALLDSYDDGNPADKNLAVFSAAGGSRYPVGVNLAYGNTGLFDVCVNGPTGCESFAVAGTISTCLSSSELVGTGYDAATPGMCDANAIAGGGTGWIEVGGNVIPGETITLRLATWDTGDGTLDTAVLLDGFRWSATPLTAGTTGD